MIFSDDIYYEVADRIRKKVKVKFGVEITAYELLTMVSIGIFEYGLDQLRQGLNFRIWGIGTLLFKDYKNINTTYEEFKEREQRDKIEKKVKKIKKINLDKSLLMKETNSNFALLNSLDISTNKNYSNGKSESNSK